MRNQNIICGIHIVPKWKELVEKMGELKSEKDLDKWLENLDIPHNVEKSRIHAEIKKFFRHETFENFAGIVEFIETCIPPFKTV